MKTFRLTVNLTRAARLNHPEEITREINKELAGFFGGLFLRRRRKQVEFLSNSITFGDICNVKKFNIDIAILDQESSADALESVICHTAKNIAAVVHGSVTVQVHDSKSTCTSFSIITTYIHSTSKFIVFYGIKLPFKKSGLSF